MTIQAESIFVNLPVEDLKRSVDFFTEVGFSFNDQFTDSNAACMVIGNHLFVMLLARDFFQTFTKKKVANAHETTETIVALGVSSRAQVDELVHKALIAGGKAANDPIDASFMYGWSFEDLDGHLWEVLYMDSKDA